MTDHSCHGSSSARNHHGHTAASAGSGGRWTTAAHSTQHCLTGCIIGEVVGLVIGIEAGLGTAATILLATTLAYISGFTLGLLPVMRAQGIGMLAAFKIIWIGEAISIGVMEAVMNWVDYEMGGMAAMTVLSWQFVRGLLVAVPAGFLAAWPVNYWLLGRNLKNCH